MHLFDLQLIFVIKYYQSNTMLNAQTLQYRTSFHSEVPTYRRKQCNMAQKQARIDTQPINTSIICLFKPLCRWLILHACLWSRDVGDMGWESRAYFLATTNVHANMKSDQCRLLNMIQ